MDMLTKKRYTPKEDEFIVENYRKNGPKYCSEQLGRSYGSITKRAYLIGAHLSEISYDEEGTVLEMLLEPLRDQNRGILYDAAKRVLESPHIQVKHIIRDLNVPLPTFRQRIMDACEHLGIEGKGVSALRLEYMRCLSFEIKILKKELGARK
jgi:hypothetical protein